ncbi:MAG: hypothetical protein MJZ58_05110 [Paludibacteraceae bacterium]|nr:hypothetical protein [Paludibacteraceae bacterium]
MKKIYTILSALVLTVTVNAQQLMTEKIQPTLIKQETPRAIYDKPLNHVGYKMNAVPFKAPTATEIDTTLEGKYFIEDQMYMSYTPGYVTGGVYLITPFTDTTYYYSVYGPGKWVYLNDEEETITVENTAILAYPSSYYSLFCNPTLSVYPRQIPSVDGSILYNVTFTDYMYAYAVESYWPGQGATPTHMTNGYYWPVQMTNCEMMTADRSGEKKLAGNRYMVSSGAAGTDWCFGTDMTRSDWGAGTLDTLLNVIPVPEGKAMWCDTVFVHCYTHDDVTDIEKVFPATTDLKLTIYPIDIEEDPETGTKMQWFRHDSVMAQATAKQTDCIVDGDGGGYSIVFVFMEENVFGDPDLKPAVLTQRCYAELTGFNESNCDFGIYSDYWETATGGRTLWLKDGKLHSYGDMNIDMAFNAYYPDMHMFSDTWIEEVPQEGGPISMGFVDSESGKNTSEEQIEFSCNILEGFDDDVDLLDENGESIDPETDPIVSYYELYGPEEYLAGIAYVEVNPNEGYDLETTIYVKAQGALLPIHFKQPGALGPDPGVGLLNVKAVNDNKTYNIFGMEVDKKFKGVVIRNGQTLLQ